MKGKGCFNFVLILICYRSCQSKETLYIGGLFGLDTARGGWSSAGIIPAVQMAIDDINNSSKCLKDYHLELLIKDSQVRMNLLVKKNCQFQRFPWSNFKNSYLFSLLVFICLCVSFFFPYFLVLLFYVLPVPVFRKRILADVTVKSNKKSAQKITKKTRKSFC